nr:immunoglobulin light chain junction region [Macaca mulatta]
CQKYISVPLTF